MGWTTIHHLGLRPGLTEVPPSANDDNDGKFDLQVLIEGTVGFHMVDTVLHGYFSSVILTEINYRDEDEVF